MQYKAQKALYEQIHIYNLGIFRLLDEDDFFQLYLYKFKKLVIEQLNEYKQAFDLLKKWKHLDRLY